MFYSRLFIVCTYLYSTAAGDIVSVYSYRMHTHTATLVRTYQTELINWNWYPYLLLCEQFSLSRIVVPVSMCLLYKVLSPASQNTKIAMNSLSQIINGNELQNKFKLALWSPVYWFVQSLSHVVPIAVRLICCYVCVPACNVCERLQMAKVQCFLVS